MPILSQSSISLSFLCCLAICKGPLSVSAMVAFLEPFEKRHDFWCGLAVLLLRISQISIIHCIHGFAAFCAPVQSRYYTLKLGAMTLIFLYKNLSVAIFLAWREYRIFWFVGWYMCTACRRTREILVRIPQYIPYAPMLHAHNLATWTAHSIGYFSKQVSLIDNCLG